jgi:hypothetical protein
MCSDLEITSDDVPKCNPEGGERASREKARYPEGSECSMEYHVWLSKRWTVQGNDVGHSMPHGIDTSPKSPFRAYWKTKAGPKKSGWKEVVQSDSKMPNAIRWDENDVATVKQKNVLSQVQQAVAQGGDATEVDEVLVDGAVLKDDVEPEEFINFHGGDYRNHPCPESNGTKEMLKTGKIPALEKTRYATPLGYVTSTLSGYKKVCVHVLGVICEDNEEGCDIRPNGGNADKCPGIEEKPPIGQARKCAQCPGKACASLKNRWVEIKAQAGFEESSDAQICTKEWGGRDENQASGTEACGNGFLDSCRDSGVELDEDTGFVAGGGASDTTSLSFRPSAKYMFYCKEDCDTRQTKFFWRILASELPNEVDYRVSSPYFGSKNLHYDGDYIGYFAKFYHGKWISSGDMGHWQCMDVTTSGGKGLLEAQSGETCTSDSRTFDCKNLARFVKRSVGDFDGSCEPISESLWYKKGNDLKAIPPRVFEFGQWGTNAGQFWAANNPDRCSLDDGSKDSESKCTTAGGTWLKETDINNGKWYLPVHQPDAENWCEHRAEVIDYPESLMDPYNRECENDQSSSCSSFASSSSSASTSASSLSSSMFMLGAAAILSALMC